MENNIESIAQDAANVSLADGSKPVQTPQQSQPLVRPLRMIAATGGSTRNITTEFSQAASALETGQLVKDAYFTLFESVGALEIMDPKMDSGYLQPGETLEDQYDVSRMLLPEEVLGIMDQMLCYEMAWHMGNPLSQTLFTSFYLDRMLWPQPKSLEEARFDRDKRSVAGSELVHVVLRAYCLALVKACDSVHRTVGNEHYYEEEDFVTNLYHRDLLTAIPIEEIVSLIDQAIAWVNSGPSILEDRRVALRIRLELRKEMLHAVSLERGVGGSQKRESWATCAQLIPTVRRTNSMSLPVDSAFSHKIQRRLASSVPPRPIVNITFDDAHAFFVRTCVSAQEAFGILQCPRASHAMRFIGYFQSRVPQPPVYVRCLVQSFLLHEMKVLDQTSIKQFLFDDLEELCVPASILVDPKNDEWEAPQHPRFQINRKMETLVTRSADGFFEIFRALCMNRSRSRRMLCHLIIEWDNVQLDAETLDIEMREYTEELPIVDPKTPGGEIWSFPLSSWAYYHKLQQMEWIVSSGFELNIYRVDELGGMYWYLQHLANTRLQHLERVRTFTNRRLTRSSKLSPDQKEAFSRSLAYLDFTGLEASAIQSFADGLSSLYALLAHISILPNPYGSFPYGSASLRYAIRMRPFMSLSIPEVPSYTDFAALASLPADSEGSEDTATKDGSSRREWHSQAKSLVENAVAALKNARKEWEAISKSSPANARTTHCEDWWRVDVKNVQKACIAANIAVEAARIAIVGSKATAEATHLKQILKVDILEQGKGYHPWWIVPKITVIS